MNCNVGRKKERKKKKKNRHLKKKTCDTKLRENVIMRLCPNRQFTAFDKIACVLYYHRYHLSEMGKEERRKIMAARL